MEVLPDLCRAAHIVVCATYSAYDLRVWGLLPAAKAKTLVTRILVVDDSREVCATLRQVLKRADANWEVCGDANNGYEAIEKAVELKPDLILLDMAMPQLDGISAARMIRAKLPEVPILIYTFMNNPFIEEMAKQAGAQGVVQKGNLAALVAEIGRVLPPKNRAAVKAVQNERDVGPLDVSVSTTAPEDAAAAEHANRRQRGATASRLPKSGEDENPPEAM
jgi:CheY-like chemotaxis protein